MMEKTTKHVMLISKVPSNAVAYHSHLLFRKYLHTHIRMLRHTACIL